MSQDGSRLLDLARRHPSGEALDWEKEGVAESEVREGMARLERPAPPPPPPRPREDRFIGEFRLVRRLGEGGMGIVHEAEQQHPHRPVALEVIHGGAHVSQDTLKLLQRESLG